MLSNKVESSTMKRLITVFLLSSFGVCTLLSSAGCEEEPDCRKACMHACEICNGDCDTSDPDVLEALEGCEESCKMSDTPRSRVDCVLETDSCDQLWKC